MEDIGSDVMDQVISAMNAYDYEKYTEADVRRAIAHDIRTPEDFAALLSPAALPLLEEIAQAPCTGRDTKTFRKQRLHVYSDLHCKLLRKLLYLLWFQLPQQDQRAQLNEEEIEKEMAAIAKTGLQEI